jgi:hypothetical protein
VALPRRLPLPAACRRRDAGALDVVMARVRLDAVRYRSPVPRCDGGVVMALPCAPGSMLPRVPLALARMRVLDRVMMMRCASLARWSERALRQRH